MLPGRKKKGRPQRRFIDVVKKGIQRFGVTEEHAGMWCDNLPRPVLIGAAKRRRNVMS